MFSLFCLCVSPNQKTRTRAGILLINIIPALEKTVRGGWCVCVCFRGLGNELPHTGDLKQQLVILLPKSQRKVSAMPCSVGRLWGRVLPHPFPASGGSWWSWWPSLVPRHRAPPLCVSVSPCLPRRTSLI